MAIYVLAMQFIITYIKLLRRQRINSAIASMSTPKSFIICEISQNLCLILLTLKWLIIKFSECFNLNCRTTSSVQILSGVGLQFLTPGEHKVGAACDSVAHCELIAAWRHTGDFVMKIHIINMKIITGITRASGISYRWNIMLSWFHESKPLSWSDISDNMSYFMSILRSATRIKMESIRFIIISWEIVSQKVPMFLFAHFLANKVIDLIDIITKFRLVITIW